MGRFESTFVAEESCGKQVRMPTHTFNAPIVLLNGCSREEAKKLQEEVLEKVSWGIPTCIRIQPSRWANLQKIAADV